MEAFIDKRSESKSLTSTPIDTLTVLNRLFTSFVNLLDGGMEGPVVRKSCDLKAKFSKFISLHSSLSTKLAAILNALPLLGSPLFNLEIMRFAGLISSLKLSFASLLKLVGFLGSEYTL